MTGADDVTEDGFLGGRLVAIQPAARAHRSGLDAVLLSAAVPDGAGGTLADLGAGVGVAGLSAALRSPALAVVLVERDPATADLARRTLARNGPDLSGRARVVEADVTAAAAVLDAAGLTQHMADRIILNPPFHPAERSRPSTHAARAAAHRIEPEDLDRWLRAAARLCRPDGETTVIFRADETPRLLAAMAGRFGGLRLRPVHPRADAPASRVIVAGSPRSRAPFALLPPLVLHEADGRYTGEADAVLRGAPLPMARP